MARQALIDEEQRFSFFATYEWAPQARTLVPGKPFQPSLMFVGEARSLH